MNKTLHHVKENSEYVEASRIIGVNLTPDYQISCVFTDGHGDDERHTPYNTFRGEIIRIHLDKDGEAYGYDVYIY